MSSGIKTHENGPSNTEIDENTVAEDELLEMIMCKILMFLPIHIRQLRNHQSTVTT